MEDFTTMRKNILTLCLVMTAFAASQSAFASRARLAVLSPNVDPVGISGNNEHGSFLVDDAYNMFYSPARIADSKNMMIVEKSNGQGTATMGEGGFVTSIGGFNLGAYLNRTTGINGNYATAAQSTDAVAQTGNNTNMRPIDLMFGGEASNVKYGLGLFYGSNRSVTGTTTTAKANELNIRAGIDVENLEVFGNVNAIGDNKYTLVANPEQKVKNTEYMGGLRYKYGEWLAYGGYKGMKTSAPTTLITTTTNNKEQKTTAFGFGIGRNAKLAESTMMNYSIGYFRTKSENTTAATTAVKTETTQVYVPLNVSLESEIASWFIARAGMGYDLVAYQGKSNSAAPQSLNNGTKVRLGGTLRFGKVDIDTAVGTGNATADTTTENVDGTADRKSVV